MFGLSIKRGAKDGGSVFSFSSPCWKYISKFELLQSFAMQNGGSNLEKFHNRSKVLLLSTHQNTNQLFRRIIEEDFSQKKLGSSRGVVFKNHWHFYLPLQNFCPFPNKLGPVLSHFSTKAGFWHWDEAEAWKVWHENWQ